MHAFHIRYRNTQGTLMRILNAASRRALDMPYVQAIPTGHEHTATLLLEVNAKQIGQLCRDWYAIVDVTDVRVGVPPKDLADLEAEWSSAPHPPSSTGLTETRAARA
ncbi:MAG: hypothetical protein WB421_05790 [Terriglobales bacterium]|jgi:acetolactate synthase small subunit